MNSNVYVELDPTINCDDEVTLEILFALTKSILHAVVLSIYPSELVNVYTVIALPEFIVGGDRIFDIAKLKLVPLGAELLKLFVKIICLWNRSQVKFDIKKLVSDILLHDWVAPDTIGGKDEFTEFNQAEGNYTTILPLAGTALPRFIFIVISPT